MAKDIKINGVTYNGVKDIDVPLSTGGGTAKFMETSDATANADDVAVGTTAYSKGAKVVGTLDISGKADKVSGATNDNLAALDSGGNIKDSGSKAADFAPSKLYQTTTRGADTNQYTKVLSVNTYSYSRTGVVLAIQTSNMSHIAGILSISVINNAPVVSVSANWVLKNPNQVEACYVIGGTTVTFYLQIKQNYCSAAFAPLATPAGNQPPVFHEVQLMVGRPAGAVDVAFMPLPMAAATGQLDITNGGTGANNAADARTNLGAEEAGKSVQKAGDVMTGPLQIRGTAASKPLQLRGITGDNGSGTADDLYLQYGASKKVMLGSAGGYEISADGSTYSGNAANVTGIVAIANGGTGSTTAANARTALGIRTYSGSVSLAANSYYVDITCSGVTTSSMIFINNNEAVINTTEPLLVSCRATAANTVRAYTIRTKASPTTVYYHILAIG